MTNETNRRLHDALVVCQAIGRSTAGLDFAAFLDADVVRDAVVYRLIVLGAALNRLARIDPVTAARIPDLRRIVATRNRVVHAYHDVDDEIVWDIVVTELPRLTTVIAALLAEDGPR